MPDDRPPDPPPPSVALALGLLAAVVVIAACAGIDRARRAWRRLRWLVGGAMIDVGQRALPPLPPELDTPEAWERRKARTLATWERERRRGRGAGRSNGRCQGEDMGPI